MDSLIKFQLNYQLNPRTKVIPISYTISQVVTLILTLICRKIHGLFKDSRMPWHKLTDFSRFPGPVGVGTISSRHPTPPWTGHLLDPEAVENRRKSPSKLICKASRRIPNDSWCINCSSRQLNLFSWATFLSKLSCQPKVQSRHSALKWQIWTAKTKVWSKSAIKLYSFGVPALPDLPPAIMPLQQWIALLLLYWKI